MESGGDMAPAGKEPERSCERPTRVRWLVFALACGASWFLYLHRYTWNLIRPELAREFGLSNTQLEALFSAFNISYAAGHMPSRCNLRPVRRSCLPGGDHGVVVADPAIFRWGRHGLSARRAAVRLRSRSGRLLPGSIPRDTHWYPRSSRTIIQGIIVSFCGRSGGAMASIVMGTLLVGLLGFSWRLSVAIMAAAGLAFAAAFWLLYRNRPELDSRVNRAECELIREREVDTPGPPVLPARRVLRNRSMLVFILQQFMNAGADCMYVSLMGSYSSTRTVWMWRPRGCW